MIYVSLPVHTQPAVIAGQLRNFARFVPEAVVVLHVSAEARFTLAELEQALRAARCTNTVVNPQRASTAWGRIVPAHLANIALIRSLGQASRICLHSSNDMLVRPGLAQHLGRCANLFHRRPIGPGNRWRFSHAALSDPGLRALCERLGGAAVIGSQVEGSCYDAALLFEIAELIAAMPECAPPQPYPREEVWLSTAAYGLGAQADGSPYVFSEIHRFDRVFWQVLRYLDPLLGRPGAVTGFLRRSIEYLMIRSGFHRISRRWVDSVAADQWHRLARYSRLSDGNSEWRVFERHGLYGVKRVPRRVDAPLRLYIDSLPERGMNQT